MDQNMRQSLLLKKIISLFETYINTVDKNYKDITLKLPYMLFLYYMNINHYNFNDF